MAMSRTSSLPFMGRVDSAEPSGVGKCGFPSNIPDGAEFPTPDFALLRLDPPHKGEGGSISLSAFHG